MFNLSGSRLSTNLSLPATIDNFPQSASNPYYIKVSPLYARETGILVWEWEFPETGEPQNDAQGDNLSFTINYLLEGLPSGGGGGGGGDGGWDGGSPPEPQPLQLQVDMWGKVTSGQITHEGVVIETIEAVSPDGALVLLLPQGTRVLDSAGNPLDLIEVKPVPPPEPPLGKFIIGLAYDLQPPCTFDPPIKFILHYEPQGLSDGIDENDLAIAYWDQGSQEWVVLPGVVDTAAEIVTAQLSHSSMFAMLAVAPVAPLIPAPEPTVPPPPKTTPAPTLGTGVWLGIGAGVAVLLALTVWLITRRHRQQSRALRRDL